MFDIDNTQAQSVTATVCENAQLFGATPERDEFDPREVWDEDDAMDAVGEAFRILAQGVGPTGTQLADERESLLWGFVNTFDAQVRRLDRSVDRLSPELRDLQTSQDGTEIKSRELELVTDRAQNFGDRRDAFEKMRDAAADAYRADTGGTWRPRRGSNVSQTGKLTSAAIDARDFMRARKDRETRAHLPQGTLVAIAGGKHVSDAGAVIARLDKAKAKYDDIILVHGGGPGVERIAAQWAERNGVHQVVCKPDWNAHGRAAPFRRNDELLNLLPKGVTSAAIDARDFMRARKDRETRAHLPQGTLVAIAGGKHVSDAGAVIARLDKAKAKYDDIILVHGGGPGVERIAAQWAERNGVHQVVCKPDWNAHGRAAPFRRNDELLNLLPKGVIAFPGSGITDNLVDKAVKLGIPVQRVAA